MISKAQAIAALFGLMLCAPASPLYCHGATYEVLTGGVVGIKASFDTGEPMAAARVLVFAPGETEKYYETTADRNGTACFSPDREGMWVIQVLAEGGHGLRVNLPVDSSMSAQQGAGSAKQGTSSASGTSYLQKIIMAIAVAWGFIATGLFFSRKRDKG